MPNQITRRHALTTLTAGIVAAPLLASAAEQAAIPDAALVVVVCDPLAAPLSCTCVKGYAQRDYNKLGKYLQEKLGRPVTVVFAETLAAALQRKTAGKADVVIGKESVIRADAKANKLAMTRIAALTGQDGAITQTGLVVVAAADPALTADALKDYRILFGPANADEQHAKALELLSDLNVPVPAKLETCAASTEGATRVLALHKQGIKAAAIIPSYSPPLLEGCGTIHKGELRVVGRTDPVPFVAAFVTGRVSAADSAAITAALLETGKLPELCSALETKSGFVDPPLAMAKKK
jgi:ABC-type phosphate/phosphonate transport system substrate-binding protein